MTIQATSPEISTSTGTAISRRLKSQASTTIIPGTSLVISTNMVTATSQRSFDLHEHEKAPFRALFACLATR